MDAADENVKIVLFPVERRLYREGLQAPERLAAIRNRLKELDSAIRSLKAVKAATFLIYLDILGQSGPAP